MTGRQLAALAGWHSSKVSKIEYGKQTPSEEDIRVWCHHGGTPEQADDLIIAVRDIEALHVEWRRRLRTGTKARQEKSLSIESETELLRWYEPVLIPGLLHTAEYATAVLQRIIAFYEVPDDVNAGVAARMERQRILYGTQHRFHFVLAEQALRTMVGDQEVMSGQLDRILSVMSLPRVRLGIVPAHSPYRVPGNPHRRRGLRGAASSSRNSCSSRSGSRRSGGSAPLVRARASAADGMRATLAVVAPAVGGISAGQHRRSTTRHRALTRRSRPRRGVGVSRSTRLAKARNGHVTRLAHGLTRLRSVGRRHRR